LYQSLDFSHERNVTADDLVRRVEAYYPDADFVMLRKAFHYAVKAHEGQKRSSGEDYIIHPINVSITLIKLRMDLDSIIAGLLHDVVEDCGIEPIEIQEEFNPAVAQIVVGLTKISKIKFKTKEESQAENFRKMVVAMAKDIRVIIVKLADRMHNMRTLQYVSEEKQHKIAQETLDIYVPLASRLGINSVKAELEDLCLRFIKPDMYYKLAEKVAMKRSERETYIRSTVSSIKDRLLEYSLKAEVKGRPKHFYSIYKKMVARSVDYDQIQDVLAFRVIVSNITECYKCLGVIHSSYTPIPGRFKDYIAIPKVNNYQSLHTTVIGPKAERIEIQIRTHEMDEVAETGVAAHWKYKEGIAAGTNRLDWIQELLDYNQAVENNSEFMYAVKNDLDIGGVFVFTPQGDVRELRYGATPLDFAYSVHTEVGHKCVGAKVNGKMVPLRYHLKSGDTIEILTNKTQRPSKDWLNIVKSGRGRTKIKQYLLKVDRDQNKEIGLDLFEKACRVLNTSLKTIKKMGELDTLVEHFSVANFDDLLIQIGAGRLDVKNVLTEVPSIKRKSKDDIEDPDKKLEELNTFSSNLSKRVLKKSQSDNAVIVDGLDDLLVRMARCCNPIPGDPIVGYITRGRGVTVHTNGCARIDKGEMSRTVSVEWNDGFNFKHPVAIRVITLDKPGILSLISNKITDLGINIRSALAKSLPDRKGSFVFEIEVKDYSELIKTINNIEGLEEVINVNRV
jgi:GTP diphosphokinase / guanosine-3',5'-bis(diphosphate) 3'-diphosphatase